MTPDATLTLTSQAFAPNGSIPAMYTCDGANISPPLLIAGVPGEARSLALIVEDPDIPEEVKQSRNIDVFDHWIVFNMPPTSRSIREGEQPVGVEGQNSGGTTGYTGPCPPAAYEPKEHRYVFTLYAVDVQLDLPEGATKKEVRAALQGHILQETTLVGRYERG